MNHSCAPNCRQFTVSDNRHDVRKYELAFFAVRPIPAGEELVFDYMDRDDEGDDGDDEGGGRGQVDDAFECRCGSLRCRGRLWF